MKHYLIYILSLVVLSACTGNQSPPDMPIKENTKDTLANSTELNNIEKNSEPTATPQKIEKKDLIGYWMDQTTYNQLQKDKSYTKNLDPAGFRIIDEDGLYKLLPFTIEADIEMSLSEEAKEQGYRFNGQEGAGYYAEESYIKLLAPGRLRMIEVMDQEKIARNYVPYQEIPFLIMGGQYTIIGVDGKELGKAEFKDKNKLSFDSENYVYYDLVTDMEKDLLLLSTVDAREVDFAVFTENLQTYVIEVTKNGFSLYENKNFEKTTFDIITADGYPEVERAEKGDLIYQLNK
ncbi:MAG: hypothetical protein MK212_04740 [Saprospiraceae bacterium]|nr:hypothetical protein [Saprospiraceae bacterium]